MRLLAWDTSSKVGSIAALEWGDDDSIPVLASEWTLNVDTVHSERLLWGIDQLLLAARWKLEEVDLFAVGVGPGSFTGIRIGVTTARTLSHTLKKPLLAISSLAALARPVALALPGNLVIAATDACKGELFAIIGKAEHVADCVQPELWKRSVAEGVYSPEDIMKEVKKKLETSPKSKWVVIGEGRQRYPEAWKKLPKSRELVSPLPFSNHVQGRFVGLLAWEGYKAGLAQEGLEVHPRYLRASDAELKLKAGLLVSKY